MKEKIEIFHFQCKVMIIIILIIQFSGVAFEELLAVDEIEMNYFYFDRDKNIMRFSVFYILDGFFVFFPILETQ